VPSVDTRRAAGVQHSRQVRPFATIIMRCGFTVMTTPHCRRAGQQCRCHTIAAQTVTSTISHVTQPGEMPAVNGNSACILDVNIGQLFRGRLGGPTSAIQHIRRHGPLDNVHIGLFNACSVSNKSSSIQQKICDWKLSLAALVEMWHDEWRCLQPDLNACAMPGFSIIEKECPRKNKWPVSTNHGGVCLLYEALLHARLVQLPNYSTIEVVATYVHRAGFNAVVVDAYRSGSRAITLAFSTTSTICSSGYPSTQHR